MAVTKASTGSSSLKNLRSLKSTVDSSQGTDFDVARQVVSPTTLKKEGIAGFVTRTWGNKSTAQPPLPISYFRPVITAMQMIADSLSVVLSFTIGYGVWQFFGHKIAPGAVGIVNLQTFLFPLAVTLITLMVGFQVNGLYHAHRSILNIREFEVLLKTCIVGLGISISILFLAEQHFFSRELYGFIWFCLIATMFIQRSLFFKFQNRLRMRGVVRTNALVYGAGEVGQKLLDKLKQSPKLGYHVAGFMDDDVDLQGKLVSDVPVLGGFAQLREAILGAEAQNLFIALPQVPNKVVEEIMSICRDLKCEFQIVPTLYDIVIQRVKLDEVDGIPLIGVSEPRYSWRTMVSKRIFDFILASIMLILFSPLMITFSIIVKMTSKGPIFFRQKRIGKKGRKFVFYKFRSMFVNTPVYAHTPGSSSDSRITKIGKFLRRTSLDELPQLWNVVKGEMSLVGPRPEMPFIVEKYNELQRQRLNVRPGITGLWQISPDRRFAIHENMDYDIYYISNQSFLLDFVILIRTATSCIKGIGAY